AVVPAGDAQAVARAAVAGAPAGSGWQLAAGADRGDGRGPRAGAVSARAVAALGAGDDPGAPGEAGAGYAPAGDGQCRAGQPGEAERASRYSGQAGNEARAVLAVDEAIRHYEQARALLQAPGQQGMTGSEVEHLYVHLGQAYVFQNAWDKAQDAYEELLTYAR